MKRFKSRLQFQAALGAPVVARTPHFAMHRVLSVPSPPESGQSVFSEDAWVGAMVPKRWAKRAVTRNTLKRQIYAVSTSLEREFACSAYLIRLRAEFSRQFFPSASSPALKEAARAELTRLLQAGLKAP